MADPAAPAVPDIAYELADGHDRVTLRVGGERFSMDAGELERLVQFLGMVRSAMTPEVEPDLPDRPFLQIEGPRLAVRLTSDQRWAGIVVRTPPYGWIAYHLDRGHAADLGRHLAEVALRMREPA